VQHLGLSQQYLSDEVICKNVRRLMALGFLEVGKIRTTFDQLRVSAPAVLLQLFVYFEQQWLGTVSIHMWNVHDIDLRTNNNCEGEVLFIYLLY